MGELYRLKEQLLADRNITNTEVELIHDYIHRNGRLDLEDVQFLVSLLSEAREVCPAFDDLFFPALKQVLLQDGRIGQDEQFYLLKMIYSDGHIRDRERKFLRELRAEVKESTPDFDALCETALAAESKGWSVGGRER